MTESSFPIVGADFTSDQWSQALSGFGNGVIDDWGSPYAITLNTNDTATIAVSTVTGMARALVAGFGHRLTAPVTLPIPAVSSTTTYTIGLLYDPGQAATPVALTVLTGNVTLTTGQVWLPLYVIVRQASQALTSATLSAPLVRLTPRLSVSSQAALLAQNPQTYLRGTTVFCTDTAATFRASLVGSTPTWVPLEATGSLSFAGIYSSSSTSPVVLAKEGKRVSSEGLVLGQNTVYNVGTTYTAATSMTSGFAPAHDKQFITRTGTGLVAFVAIQAAGSVLFSLAATYTGALTLSLDGLNWRTP
jgi:hypothetical protein